MPGTGDLTDRGHDLLVIDDAAAVLAGVGGLRCRGQLDRDAHPLQPLTFDAAHPDAAQQHEVAHHDDVAVRSGHWALRHSTDPIRSAAKRGVVLSSRDHQFQTYEYAVNGRGACGGNSVSLRCAAVSWISRSGSFSAPPSRQSSTRWSTTSSCRRSVY